MSGGFEEDFCRAGSNEFGDFSCGLTLGGKDCDVKLLKIFAHYVVSVNGTYSEDIIRYKAESNY